VIYALARRRTAFGIGDYLRTDGLPVAGLVTVLTYEAVFETGLLPIGAYLFTGLDELTATETALVMRARQALAEASPSTGRFNDPTRWLRRGALLQVAFDAGVNSFRATRATQRDPRRRFPVFIRAESEHAGALSPLLYDELALVRALLLAMIRGHRLRDLLIVEYSHTADAEGVFTKYSAMILGSDIVPRSLTRNREIMTKFDGRITDRSAADADLQYVTDNPHEPWLRRIFAMGGVEYGRIDYALRDGQPEVWEINTNPTIGANLAIDQSVTTKAVAAGCGAVGEALRRMERGNLLFYDKFRVALESLARATDQAIAADGAGPAPAKIPITWMERRRLGFERSRRDQLLARRTAVGLLLAPLRAGYRMLRAAGVAPFDSGRWVA
jgi:hypothetical protein